MADFELEVAFPDGANGHVIMGGGGKYKVGQVVPDLRDGFGLIAVCRSCDQAVVTGVWLHHADLPLRRAGRWRHGCGGSGLLPDEYEIADRRTGVKLNAYAPDRAHVEFSAVTLAELLRLVQAARAVQRGEPGADVRLDRVLADSPPAIRRLRDRLKPEAWIALAALLISLAAYLTPLLKDDGQVTEQHLVDVIERLIEQHPDLQPRAPDPEAGFPATPNTPKETP